jgi:hypothetical protein
MQERDGSWHGDIIDTKWRIKFPELFTSPPRPYNLFSLPHVHYVQNRVKVTCKVTPEKPLDRGF